MKIYFLKGFIVISFLLFTGFGGCNFIEIVFSWFLPPPAPIPDYNDMESYHSGGYIMVANEGKIYFTDQYSFPPSTAYTVPGNPDLLDAYRGFHNDSINIVVGANGTILRSSRNTPEWTLIASPVSNNLNKIFSCAVLGTFEDTYLIAGDNGTILKSADLGFTWEVIPFPNTENLRDIHSIFCEIIEVSGDNYTLYRSEDGGATWFPVGPGDEKITGSQQGYNRIYYYNDSLAYVGGPNGLILKSTNGGQTWQTKVAPGFQQINDLFFISPDSGVAVGTNGIARFTTDGGDTWEEDPDVTNFLNGRNVKRIFAISHNYGFIVGDGGLSTFIAPDSTYLDSAFVTTVSVYDDQPIEFNLYNNFPNPFNPTTTIKYSIPQLSKVVIKVYNTLGQEVAILVNEEKQPGYYEVEFNASTLASGIYYYTLRAGDFIQTKKMILLK